MKGNLIISGKSDEASFNRAARYRGAVIIIQRNSNNHCQFYFNPEKVDDKIIDTIASMVRLEECLIQKRKIPKDDLRKAEWIKMIPEWYYYKAIAIPGKKKKPGRFILNGSITAPDVPPTKIPLTELQEIAQKAVIFQPFNWWKWEKQRLTYYNKS